MRKLIPVLAVIPLTVLALIPPWTIQLDCTINSLLWLFAVFTSGFLAFMYLYQNVSVWLKLLVLWCFASCFISNAPYMSFTLYWTVITCAYYYALCRKIEDWSIFHKVIQSVFFFIVLLIIMQLAGKDTLLNFNHKAPIVLGTIGNPMILGSYICVLAPFLIKNKLNWIALVLIAFISGSSGTVLAIFAGLSVLIWHTARKLRVFIVLMGLIAVIFAGMTRDIAVFTTYGRFPIWKRTAELIVKRPLGYGVATYKLLFPVMSGDLDAVNCTSTRWEYDNTKGNGLAWRRTHNSFLQLPFEIGIPGLILCIGWIVSVMRKVNDPVRLAGITILATNMLTAFPERMIQSVLIILAFLAYYECGERQQSVYNGGIWIEGD